jgi:hypothetical protein
MAEPDPQPSSPDGLLDPTTRGERLAGFIYGTILVLSLIAEGAKAYPDGPGRVAVIVLVTTVVFWLAHTYAYGLGHSVSRGVMFSFDELRHIGRHQASIIRAALLPAAVLVVGAFGLLSASTAFWGAFAVGLVVLAAQGIQFARLERLGLLGTLGIVALNIGLGVVLIGLKVLVSHV